MIHIWESQDPVMDENKGIGSLYLSDLTSTWTTIPELIDLSNQFNAHYVYMLTVLDIDLNLNIQENSSGLLGISGVGGACNGSNLRCGMSFQVYPYGISFQDVETITHEVGHFLGCTHSQSNNDCTYSPGLCDFLEENGYTQPIIPTANGCYPEETYGDIMSYCPNKLPIFDPIWIEWLQYRFEERFTNCENNGYVCEVPPTLEELNSLNFHMGRPFNFATNYYDLNEEDIIRYIDWPGFKNTTTRGSKIIEIPLNQDGTFGTFEITGINLSLGEYSVIILTKSDSFSDSTIMGSIEVNYNNGEDFYSFIRHYLRKIY